MTAGLDRVELARKAVHMGSGLFALTLHWIVWWQAAAAALLAFTFNALVLQRVGGAHLLRAGERERGYAAGILVYPLVVLTLVVLFRHDLALAAAGWGYLAFGDGCAALAGKAFGRTKLPWHSGKSWAGLLGYVAGGGAGATALFAFVRGRLPDVAEVAAVLVGALVGALVESLPSELDDNVAPPLAAAGALAAALAVAAHGAPLAPSFWSRAAVAVALNLAVAGLSGAVRLVRRSGAIAGFVVGTLIYAFAGPAAYAVLWTFFLIGTLATRFGRKRKEALGKAEEAGGRRGAENVFANCGAAAFCFATGGLARNPGLMLAGVGAFATAVMDTVGTEVGQAVRSRTVLLPDLRPVPPGTDGAVSIAGTLAGLLAAALLTAVAAALGLVATPLQAGAVVAAATLGTVLESLLGRDGARWKVTNGHVLNVYNTLAGATAAFMLGAP